MNAIGVRLQALGALLVDAERRGDTVRVRELAEELFDLGGELQAREGWARLSRRGMIAHATRSPAGMLAWRLRQVFRRSIAL